METSAYEAITKKIAEGNLNEISPMIDSILSDSDNPAEFIKCASILKSIDKENECMAILDKVIAMVSSEYTDIDAIATSIGSLGRWDDALKLISSSSSPNPYNYALCLARCDEYESAIPLLTSIENRSTDESILLCECYCSVGEFSSAIKEADILLENEGNTYKALTNKSFVLFSKGEGKTAGKLIKSIMSNEKTNIDAMAAYAYVMRLLGKVAAAVNYSVRAINKNPEHTGAMTTLAYCHIEKGAFNNAKIIAGRINELEPGNPEVVKIIDACRIMSS